MSPSDLAELTVVLSAYKPMDYIPKNCELVKVTFEKGALGVTLRKLKDTGRVVVVEVIEDTQAVNLNVSLNDEIWAVGPVELGMTRVDDDVWRNLLLYMKSTRPLEITFIRKIRSRQDLSVNNSRPTSQSSSSDAQESIDAELVSAMPPKVPSNNELRNLAIESTSSLPIEVTRLPDDLSSLLNRMSIKRRPANTPVIVGKLMTSSTSGNSPTESDKIAFLKDCGVDVIKEGQRIFCEGEVGMLGRFALWHMQKKRHMVLLSDVLLILSPTSGGFEYESTIDIFSCKLMNFVKTGDQNHDGICFDVLLDDDDVESLRVVCKSVADKERWVAAIFDRIHSLWGKPDTFAWKHTYVLGSIHARVVAGDYDGVKELVALCDAGGMDYEDLERPDEQGISPLGYAAILKKTEIAEVLLNANPDVKVRDNFGLTPLHWSALHLDFATIGHICDHVLESDIDMPDAFGRSALFLACAEGKAEDGTSNDVALSKCIAALTELQANPNFEVEGTRGLPIHFVAASWQPASLEALLKGGAYVRSVDAEERSALHLACCAAPIRSPVNEMTRLLFGSATKGDSDRMDPDYALLVLRLLLQAGARPNAKEGGGKSPLQLLHEAREAWGEIFFEAVEILVSHGARIDDPQTNADFKAKCPPGFYDDAVNLWNSVETPDIGAMGLE